MRYVLLATLILAAIVWTDLHEPLTGITPAVRATDDAIDRLLADLSGGDPAAAREQVTRIRHNWRRMELGLSLLADKSTRRRFEELVERIDAGLAAGETGSLAPDAAELREVWYEMLSP